MSPQERGAHTPGPWVVSAYQRNRWDSPSSPAIQIEAHRTYVDGMEPTRYALAEVMYPTTTGNTVGAAEREANARLIAAAPDLLAALIDVQNNAASDSLAMWTRVNAAIAKATGTQP